MFYKKIKHIFLATAKKRRDKKFICSFCILISYILYTKKMKIYSLMFRMNLILKSKISFLGPLSPTSINANRVINSVITIDHNMRRNTVWLRKGKERKHSDTH